MLLNQTHNYTKQIYKRQTKKNVGIAYRIKTIFIVYNVQLRLQS